VFSEGNGRQAFAALPSCHLMPFTLQILQLSNFILEKNICGKDLYDLKDNEVSKYLKEAGVDDESLRTRFCEHVQLLKLEAVPLQETFLRL
jgi:hypothetical protein